MKGYKAFTDKLTCNDMQYEIGKTYEMNGKPMLCARGYHFCKNISDVYNYYPISDSTRICEVIALGEVVTDDNIKFCTNKIKIVREIKNKAIKHCNVNKTTVGYCNSGNCNSGNYNSGDCNSGNRNSGNDNSGNDNSGNDNSGDYNTGNYNSGNCNSGYHNSGHCNSGYYNSGDWNSGAFNTSKNPTIFLFDKQSNWTIEDWLNSSAHLILSLCPYTRIEFIDSNKMSDEEKKIHPEYKTNGGYIKTFTATKEIKQEWWDSLSDIDKQSCYDLPNFDEEKFVKCLGIDHI